MWEVIGAGIGAWALGIGGLAASQRRLIFRAPVRVRMPPLGPWARSYEVERLLFAPELGITLEVWRSSPRAGSPRGTLLYFGGRGENTAWSPHISSYLRDWSVMSFNYRGFGASTGMATEACVMADALAFAAHGLAAPSQPGPLAVMGRSLGSAVAVRVAREVAPSRLVLVSPLCSVRALVDARPLLAPARWLLRHPMNALEHAAHVACPALILLSPGDRQVPNAHSLRLGEALGGPVTVQAMPGTVHRTLPRHAATLQAVANFLSATTATP